MNDKLVNYLVKEEGVPTKGISSSFMIRNVRLKVFNLDITI